MARYGSQRGRFGPSGLAPSGGGGGAAPTNTAAPAISGTPQDGQTLNSSTGTWTNSPTAYTYQWKRDGAAISGATANSYTATPTDVGKTVTVEVLASNATGSGGPVASSGVTVVPQPPANTAAPAISGTPQDGQVLTVSNGTWTNSPTGYAYQWRRDGTAISGATANSYTAVTADVGKSITCTVTASNAGGSNSATSAGVTIAAGEDAATTALVNRMSVAPSAGRRTLIDNLIKGLKADGLWTKLDNLTILAAANSSNGTDLGLDARLNWVRSTTASAINAPTFTADRGYAGDAVSSYLDLGEGFGAGGQYTQNSATMGAWVNGQTTTLRYHIGQASGTQARLAGTTTGGRVQLNDGSNLTSPLVGSATSRHITGTRSGSAVKELYFDGNTTPVATATTASLAVVAGNVLLLRSFTSYSDQRIAAAYVGSAFTAADVANMHSRLSAYLTAIGAN